MMQMKLDGRVVLVKIPQNKRHARAIRKFIALCHEVMDDSVWGEELVVSLETALRTGAWLEYHHLEEALANIYEELGLLEDEAMHLSEELDALSTELRTKLPPPAPAERKSSWDDYGDSIAAIGKKGDALDKKRGKIRQALRDCNAMFKFFEVSQNLSSVTTCATFAGAIITDCLDDARNYLRPIASHPEAPAHLREGISMLLTASDWRFHKWIREHIRIEGQEELANAL